MQSEEEKKLHEDYYAKSDESGFSRYQWYVKKFFSSANGQNILEIGCGDGGVIQYLKEKNNVYAVDISKNAVKFSQFKGIKSFLIDISKEKLPFDDQTIDAVIALEVIEHLKSPQYAIEEIQRVLKKDGRLIVSIPNPRTGHKFLYPCLFEFNNFKKYLANNGFLILSTATFGICPPFWSKIRKFMVRKKAGQQSDVNKAKPSAYASKISGFLSSDFIALILPRIFSWSYIYECLNKNPQGAKSIYKKIAEETKQPG